MKKTILTLCMLTALCINSVFANGELKINDKVLSSFKKDFLKAEYEQWTDNGNYLKVRFVLSGVAVEACYTKDGDFLASARSVLFNGLPLTVMNAFNKKYSEESILSVTEINSEIETYYEISLETDKAKIQLKATSSGCLWITKKEKK